MTASKWTTTSERYEMRVSGGNVDQLLEASSEITELAKQWGSDVTWEVEDESIVLWFAGSSRSIGGWGA